MREQHMAHMSRAETWLAAFLREMAREGCHQVALRECDDVWTIRVRRRQEMVEYGTYGADEAGSIIEGMLRKAGLSLNGPQRYGVGRFRLDVGANQRLEVHVSMLPTHSGRVISLRLLVHSDEVPTLSSLDVDPLHAVALSSLVQSPRGLWILVDNGEADVRLVTEAFLGELANPNRSAFAIEAECGCTLPFVEHVSIPDLGGDVSLAVDRVLSAAPHVIYVDEVAHEPAVVDRLLQAAISGACVILKVGGSSSVGALFALANIVSPARLALAFSGVLQGACLPLLESGVELDEPDFDARQWLRAHGLPDEHVRIAGGVGARQMRYGLALEIGLASLDVFHAIRDNDRVFLEHAFRQQAWFEPIQQAAGAGALLGRFDLDDVRALFSDSTASVLAPRIGAHHVREGRVSFSRLREMLLNSAQGQINGLKSVRLDLQLRTEVAA